MNEVKFVTFHDYIKNHTKYGRSPMGGLKTFNHFKINRLIDSENFPNRCIRFKLCGQTFGYRTDYNALDDDIQIVADSYIDIFDIKPMEARNLLCFMYFEFRDKYNEMSEEIERLKQNINDLQEVQKQLNDIKERRSHAGRPAVSARKKQKVFELRERKFSYSQISKKLKISKATVCKIINERND